MLCTSLTAVSTPQKGPIPSADVKTTPLPLHAIQTVSGKRLPGTLSFAVYGGVNHVHHRLIWSSPMYEVSTSCHLADLTGINWATLARDRKRLGRAQMCRGLDRIIVIPRCLLRDHVHSTYLHAAV
jgi:hypothetical protein